MLFHRGIQHDEITSTIDKNRVTVIVGAAGCGKSTRAPAAVLRQLGSAGALIVAEPRRVAAIGLAERVASELGEKVGETIGYQVRLQSKLPRPPTGSILYCTSGVLLRRLQLNPGLEGCTHVVMDEAHERDVNTDVTLLLLKRALQLNKDLKVVVMSATLDTTVFTKFFDNCPVIEVPGRTFPVEIRHLDDIMKDFAINLPNTLENCNRDEGKPYINCQEVAEVIKSIDKREPEGAILVFLPGWAEIKYIKQLLDQSLGQSSMHMILPVHSRLSTTDQTKMFSQPTLGVRKIVLATNIAETSITIPDVVYVVDTGAHKENTMKEGTGMASLETVWVSLAGAKQRTGRAGRVQPGKCYRLYTKEKEAEFTPHTTPEILRIPLEQTVLDCKTYAPDEKVADFLSQLPEPPSKKSIQFAVNDLIDLGALTNEEQLTRVGDLVSRLSAHPRLGRALLHAAALGVVVPAADLLATCGSHLDVFAASADRRDEIRAIKKKYNATSDHVALHLLQHEFEQKELEGRSTMEEWCDRNGLKRDTLRYVKSLSNLHLEQLIKSSMIEETSDAEVLNRFSDIDELTCATLLSGANSLLITKKKVKTKGKLKTIVELFTRSCEWTMAQTQLIELYSAGDRAHIGTESVNYGINKHTNKPTLVAYFGGYHSTERRALVVHKTSLVSPQMALLFCKGDVKKEVISDNNGDMTVLSLPRHKLRVHLPASQADVIIKAKEMLWNTLDYYINRDIKNIDFDQHTELTRFKVKLVKAVAIILIEANREYVLGKSALEENED